MRAKFCAQWHPLNLTGRFQGLPISRFPIENSVQRWNIINNELYILSDIYCTKFYLGHGPHGYYFADWSPSGAVHYLLLSNFQPLETTFPARGNGKGIGKKERPLLLWNEFSGDSHIERMSPGWPDIFSLGKINVSVNWGSTDPGKGLPIFEISQHMRPAERSVNTQ